tara:strand:- start:1408 stop:1776 length:369 start_codon:yes stop_codon:yes gene_type:complete
MTSLATALKSMIEAVSINHTAAKSTLIKTVTDGRLYDSFAANNTNDVKVYELMSLFLNWDLDSVNDDDFLSTPNDVLRGAIERNIKALEKKEEDILSTSPSPDNLLTMYAIRRCIRLLNHAL